MSAKRKAAAKDPCAWQKPAYVGEAPYLWTDEMEELSGFGGGYEDACRKMLHAGLVWFDAQPKADVKYREAKGVYGFVDFTSPAAKEFEKVICAACPGGPTGAMVHCVTHAVSFIRAKGWAAFVEGREELRRKERAREAKEKS